VIPEGFDLVGADRKGHRASNRQVRRRHAMAQAATSKPRDMPHQACKLLIMFVDMAWPLTYLIAGNIMQILHVYLVYVR
jgi:hypothetical protein